MDASHLTVILVPAPDETIGSCQNELISFANILRDLEKAPITIMELLRDLEKAEALDDRQDPAYDVNEALRPITIMEQHGEYGGFSGDFAIKLAAIIGPALGTAAGAWLQARLGRRVRVKFPDGSEAEARTAKELETLMTLIKEFKEQNQPTVIREP